MVNLRSRSKPRAASKMDATTATLVTASDGPNLSEAALRKLPRSELQKLAMAHKVKANMKSELIIRQLSSLQIPKITKRPAKDVSEEGPLRKKFKGEVTTSRDDQLPEAGPSVPRSTSLGQKAPTKLSYDEDLFSGTESEMTEEEQLDYATPVSSRAETPPAANVNDLKRCVTIMQQISAQDVALLGEVSGVRETAARLRKKARDIRDLVKAECGRRVRMEAYFRYWQEIEPDWDRQWLYGEKVMPDDRDSNNPGEPSNVPTNSQGARRPVAAVPGRKPALSPEELKQKRQAIVAKQEAEQRQLEALRRREMRDENSAERWSTEAADECSLDGADLLSMEENSVNMPLMISFENSIGINTVPVPSP